MRRSDSPSRARVLRQKLQTAMGDAADVKSTGAPQLGQAARQARWGEGVELANGKCGGFVPPDLDGVAARRACAVATARGWLLHQKV